MGRRAGWRCAQPWTAPPCRKIGPGGDERKVRAALLRLLAAREPTRAQSVALSFGQAHVYYPEGRRGGGVGCGGNEVDDAPPGRGGPRKPPGCALGDLDPTRVGSRRAVKVRILTTAAGAH